MWNHIPLPKRTSELHIIPAQTDLFVNFWRAILYFVLFISDINFLDSLDKPTAFIRLFKFFCWKKGYFFLL